MLYVPGAMSMLMFTSKSWTEKRSVVGELLLVAALSVELVSIAGLVTLSDGDGPAAELGTCQIITI